jgi:hypothetical protein
MCYSQRPQFPTSHTSLQYMVLSTIYRTHRKPRLLHGLGSYGLGGSGKGAVGLGAVAKGLAAKRGEMNVKSAARSATVAWSPLQVRAPLRRPPRTPISRAPN